MAIDVSVIIPTYNERANIRPLMERLRQALGAMSWEVVFVDDDSPDGTSQEILAQAGRDARVRLIRRVGRRGLSSACVEGVLAASASHLVVMDADMQHDEALIPGMLAALCGQGVDLVVASRYVAGGGVGTWSPVRAGISRVGAWLTRVLIGIPVQDPLSGFFAFRKVLFSKAGPRLHGRGFKILLDLILSSQGTVRFVEFPFIFRQRYGGKTKLNWLVVADYAGLLIVRLFFRRSSVVLTPG